MVDTILITPSSFGTVGSRALALLQSSGYTLKFNPYGRTLTKNEVIEVAGDCCGIIAGLEDLSASVLRSLPQLKAISRFGAGTDNVDLAEAKRLNIEVRNTPDAPTRAVAELTLGLMFATLRNIPVSDRSIRRGEWKRVMGHLLLGKNIGVIGLGRIGRTVAQLVQSAGGNVAGYDVAPDTEWAVQCGIRLCPLEILIEQSDILTIHIPYSEHTRNFMSRDRIARMKDGAILLNLSRGGIVDEEALYDHLINSHLGGAALDTFLTEPYTGPLSTLDSVILTPHIGSLTYETRRIMEVEAAENLIEALACND